MQYLYLKQLPFYLIHFCTIILVIIWINYLNSLLIGYNLILMILISTSIISLIIVISFLLYGVYFIFGLLLYKLLAYNKSVIEELRNNNISSIILLGVIIFSLVLLSGPSIESFFIYFNIKPFFPSFSVL